MFDSFFDTPPTLEKTSAGFVDVVSKNGVPICEGGEFLFSSKTSALKSWAERALMTDRFRHTIFSYDYGSELSDLLGKGYSSSLVCAEVERLVSECVLANEFITGASSVEVSLNRDVLNISFVLDTIFGSEAMDIEL